MCTVKLHVSEAVYCSLGGHKTQGRAATRLNRVSVNRGWLAGASGAGEPTRQRLTHGPAAARRQSAAYRSTATLRLNADRRTMPPLFIIASHIVVIVIIMILYRFPLSVGVAAVLFHVSRLVWPLGARRSHVIRGKRAFSSRKFCHIRVSWSWCCLRAHCRVSDGSSREIRRRRVSWLLLHTHTYARVYNCIYALLHSV